VAQEVERKFLVNLPPDGIGASGGARLRQGYLAVDGEVEVRLRDVEGRSILTVKAGHGLARTEVELSLDADQADELWAHVRGNVVEKVRHRVDLDDELVADLDVYEGALAGLTTVEVEFRDARAATAFEPPVWFGREVTGDLRWSNAQLAAQGRPSG
jgi:CYTH domain-containing protein